jgi:hypothetical protein
MCPVSVFVYTIYFGAIVARMVMEHVLLVLLFVSEYVCAYVGASLRPSYNLVFVHVFVTRNQSYRSVSPQPSDALKAPSHSFSLLLLCS